MSTIGTKPPPPAYLSNGSMAPAAVPVDAPKAVVAAGNARGKAVDSEDFGAQATLGGKPVALQARTYMEALEQNPESVLNVKLRAAGVERAATPFSQAFAVVADARGAASIPPENLDAAMREAVKFAGDLYVAAGGRPSPFVKVIELVPQRSDGLRDLLFGGDNLGSAVDGTLQVEVPTSRTLPGAALSADDIAKEWSAGKHFADPTMAAIWPLLNPFGEGQRMLRQVIGHAAERFGVDLDKLVERLVQGDPSARTAFRGFIEDHIPAQVPTLPGGRTIQAAALERLDGANDRQLVEYARAWAASVRDPELQRDAAGGVLHVAMTEKPNILSLALSAGGAVTNSHEIAVQADAIFGRRDRVERFFGQEPSRRFVANVSLGGLFAVATHDSVDVQATLSVVGNGTQEVLPSLALERALGI